MKPPPTVAIAIGILIMAGTVYGLLNVLVINPIRPLAESDVVTIKGKIVSLQEVRESRDSTGLDVVLEGQPHPYRCFGGLYPKLMDKAVLEQVKGGEIADVGIRVNEPEPRQNRESGQTFFPMVSLQIEGRPVMPLESYNQWQAKNLNTAKWAIPVFFLLGAYVTFQGVRGRRLGLSYTPGMF